MGADGRPQGEDVKKEAELKPGTSVSLAAARGRTGRLRPAPRLPRVDASIPVEEKE